MNSSTHLRLAFPVRQGGLGAALIGWSWPTCGHFGTTRLGPNVKAWNAFFLFGWARGWWTIAAEAEPMLAKEIKHGGPRKKGQKQVTKNGNLHAQEAAAKAFGVSRGYVADAKAIGKASPERVQFDRPWRVAYLRLVAGWPGRPAFNDYLVREGSSQPLVGFVAVVPKQSPTDGRRVRRNSH